MTRRSAPPAPRPITPAMIRNGRARAAAEKSLGAPVTLAVWTPAMQLFSAADGRTVHVWTYADEMRVEVPRMSIDPGTQKLVAR